MEPKKGAKSVVFAKLCFDGQMLVLKIKIFGPSGSYPVLVDFAHLTLFVSSVFFIEAWTSRITLS